MLDRLEQLLGATSAEELWQSHCAMMAMYGFDRLIYGFTRSRTGPNFGDRADIRFLSNYSATYNQGFFDEDRYVNAPMVRWASDNVGVQSWGILAEKFDDLDNAAREVIGFNRQHGVVAGYSISFPETSRREKGAIGLCAREGLSQQDVDATWSENGREIEVLNNVLHLRLLAMPDLKMVERLTLRQREVLEWIADGKTNQDIAMILGLTPATVEKHLRLARRALNVDTTAQAVAKATFQRQIFILPI